MWCTTRLYLGPLLFLLYISDLPHCLSKTKPRLFADNTNLTASANSMTDLEAAVNSDMENLRKWLIANKLSLNVAKTEFILIGSKSMIKNISNSHPNVFVENKQIKQVYECKALGVKIDMHLSWKGNTDEICKKLTARISAIRRIMYKLLNKMGPKSLTNLFSYKSGKTNYHLRDISSSLCLPKPCTNNMKNSFMYDGAQLWNSIPKGKQITFFLSK